MFQRILVPLDGSKHAEVAVPTAARLARAQGGSIILAHMVPTDPHRDGSQDVPGVSAFEETERGVVVSSTDNYLHTVATQYADELKGTPVETERIEVQSLSDGIVSATSLEQVDLILLCVEGETFFTHWLFKHIPRQAIRHSTVPVLVVKEQGKLLNAPDAAHPFHVLVPLDGSQLAEAVLEPLAHLLKALTAPEQQTVIQLLDIIDAPHHGHDKQAGYERTRDEAMAYLQSVAEYIRYTWQIKVRVIPSVLLSSEVSETILHQAERVTDVQAPDGCDLIAMSTHSRDGIQRLIHGSVTEHILGATRFPCLIVTPTLSHKEAFQTV